MNERTEQRIRSESIQHRCPNIGRHTVSPKATCGCPQHRHLPTPCDECYSLRVTTERIPWQPDVPWHDVIE